MEKLAEEIMGEYDKTGTTIVALTFDGGIFLAADSRTTNGSMVSSRNTDKINLIHDRIYALVSGTASHTKFLCKLVTTELMAHGAEIGKLPSVKVGHWPPETQRWRAS